MIRPVLSYVLSGLILLTQVGIPLHKHYCKGMLESVSVFYAQKCNDHGAPATKDACCKKEANNCTATDNSCCTDEVTVVSQQADYLNPSLNKWIDMEPAQTPVAMQVPVAEDLRTSSEFLSQASDSGPPLYILYQSLIIYA